MVCEKHGDLEVGIAEVKVGLKAVEKNQDIMLCELRAFRETLSSSLNETAKEKISKFTFILVVTIFTGIIGYIALDVKELKAEINSIAKFVK